MEEFKTFMREREGEREREREDQICAQSTKIDIFIYGKMHLHPMNFR